MATTVQAQPEVRRFGVGFDFDSLTSLHYVAMSLAAITGAVHLYWTQEFVPFLVAGLAFFAAIVALTINIRGFRYYRTILYAGGIPFTAAQMGMWYFQGMPDFTIGVVDKTIQALLILVLAYLLVRELRTIRAERETVAPIEPTA